MGKRLKDLLLGQASLPAAVNGLEPARIDALQETDTGPRIKLNRQNRARLRHDNRRLMQTVLREAKVAGLRKFWADMFPGAKKEAAQ